MAAKEHKETQNVAVFPEPLVRCFERTFPLPHGRGRK